MQVGLAERQRLQGAFGPYVDPALAVFGTPNDLADHADAAAAHPAHRRRLAISTNRTEGQGFSCLEGKIS
jgi:hypothetical protein